MNFKVIPPRVMRGTVSVPGDKSISHRALVFGALAEGETVIENFLRGQDCLATMSVLKALGVEFKDSENGLLTVYGRGLNGLREPEDVLNAANSGTTARLMLGVLSGQPFFSVITGDDSLRRRPMKRVIEPLSEMGAILRGRRGGKLLPVMVQGGNLRGISYQSPVASAQVKSSVLLAGLFAKGNTSVTEPFKSRDHTERMLNFFGAKINIRGKTTEINGGQTLSGKKVKVPGDMSSAAFLLVAGAIHPDACITITGVGVNPTRSGILDVLRQMGADLELSNHNEICGEPVADICVRSSRLKGTVVKGEMIPRLIDEIPVLSVAAALAEGRTEIRDASELKVKESDRISTVAAELRKFGVKIQERPDGMVIEGSPGIKGTVCESYGDHRIAMAMTVAGLVAEGETIVRDAKSVAISFPGFEAVLNSIRAAD